MKRLLLTSTILLTFFSLNSWSCSKKESKKNKVVNSDSTITKNYDVQNAKGEKVTPGTTDTITHKKGYRFKKWKAPKENP
jgi:hypothetical protein